MAITVGGWGDVASSRWVADVVARSTSLPWVGWLDDVVCARGHCCCLQVVGATPLIVNHTHTWPVMGIGIGQHDDGGGVNETC